MSDYQDFIFACLDGYERAYTKHLTGEYGEDRFVQGALAAIRGLRNAMQDEVKFRLHLADKLADAEKSDNVINLMDALRKSLGQEDSP